MQCPEQKWLSTDEYMEKFITMARQRRIPLSGSFEITSRCNMKCVHCYLGPRGERQAYTETSAVKIRDIIDEITDAGCLYMLFTGGEPLLRDDFPQIYRYAKEKGLLVTVFTNGTLITDKVAGMFRELPPHEVEISLYGATAPTYERITGIPGSYKRCMDGIKLLVDNKIKVRLKTILMTLNVHELSEMQNIARGFGSGFRFDAAISPGLGGDKTPLELRVSPEEVVDREFADDERGKQWKMFFEGSKEHVLTDELYGCGAGVTGFHIDSTGNLHPCLMVLDICYDLSATGFIEAWKDMISRIKERKARPDFPCRGCVKINLCGYCPAFFSLENGAEDVHSEYICRMGNLRYQRINDHHLKGANYGS
jgi:radical SAM protein with 4Fe4S-binding SPASM domain